MIFIFIVLWAIAIITFFIDSKRLKWASFTAFAGGCGAFGRVVTEIIIPYLYQEGSLSQNIHISLNWIAVIASLINILGLPYFFLLFSLSYSQVVKGKGFNKISGLLLLPIFFMLFTSFPFYPDPQFNYPFMIIWVAPYIIFGFYFLIKSYRGEKNNHLKRSKGFTIILVFPVLIQLVGVYILRVFNIYEGYRLNVISIGFLFVFFLIFITKYDAFGIKVKFENKQLEHSLRAMTNGSEMLNHAIKNQIVKINACAFNLKQEYNNSQREVPFELNIIESSSEHLMEMMKRYQEKTQEIILNRQDCSVNELLNDVLMLKHMSITKKEIVINNNIPSNLILKCDPYHVKEVLLNIINNSIDAMKDQGHIEVEVFKEKKYLIISIRDNGEGISKHQLERVFEPFFSTKKATLNFGLGLSYCYQVLNKHNGFLKIYSDEGKGTTVSLSFPSQ
ncbi:MAG TPA: hypothetical protein DDY49_13490 [Paenibacillaceae bacterium]|nr:hypothetical protein [Paenibacillaceae bacterium]